MGKRHKKHKKHKNLVKTNSQVRKVEQFDAVSFMFKPAAKAEIEFLKSKDFDHNKDLLVIPKNKLHLFIFRPTASIIVNCNELAIIRSWGDRNLF